MISVTIIIYISDYGSKSEVKLQILAKYQKLTSEICLKSEVKLQILVKNYTFADCHFERSEAQWRDPDFYTGCLDMTGGWRDMT